MQLTNSFARVEILRQQGYRYCPNPLCSKPLNIQNNIKRRVQCPHCNRSFCRKFGGEYHRWLQCDTKYRVLCAVNNTQPCPKCNAMIEKNEGCKHIACAQCFHEFCWVCRND
ncbi:hypothetical protein THRCLA_23251 [Thraustotheca clavata]|uniref:RBR-type E3 ubiquitin transferase n=1 Tax=Thraustotheca clavata TaxID=74557 RepID=A0A1V9Y8K1_9STRA|nr:hypothetical protein THRCLA_23251 [Thraustotheca clavata]